MADKYGNYCANCVHKDVPDDEMPCAGNGFPPFWPHQYPNCFGVAPGVTIDVAGRLKTPDEVFVEKLVEAVASDEVMEEMDRIVAEAEEEPGPLGHAGDEPPDITEPEPDIEEEDTGIDEEELAALEGDASVVDALTNAEGIEEEEPEDDTEELYGEEPPEEEPEQPIAAVADVDAKGLYYCTECGHNHKYGSATGKEHLEYAGDPPQD